MKRHSVRKRRSARRVGALPIALLALAMMLLVGRGPVAQAATQPPTATPAQKAEAVMKPSTVFIVTEWSGYILSGELGDLLSTEEGTAPLIKATTTCSGFIANPDGYIVTAGHCVDDTSMAYGGKGVIINAGIAQLGELIDLSASDVAVLQRDAYANAKVEGKDKDSPPDRVVGVFPTKGAATIISSTPIQANVVDFQSFTKGDVALLKVETKTPMPALEVAPSAAAQGTGVVAGGFPGSVLDTVDPNVSEPSFKDGTVSGGKTVAGVPFTEISAATSSGMSGGPVVDLQGRVVGTVSWSPGAETQSFNFITATSSVRQLLASNSVDNKLSTTDTTYRNGLTAYFAGKYHEAAKTFDDVLALEPDHAMAQEYKRLSVTNYPLEKSSGSSIGLWIGIGGGIVVLLGGAMLLMVRRRRHGGPAAPPVTPVAAVGPPAFPPPAVEPIVPASASPSAPTAEEHVGAGYCPSCGAAHGADVHFCESCGAHLGVPV